MSLKNMAMKLAIAFAAAKGVEAFRKSGGMEGVRRKLATQGGGSGLEGLLGAAGGAPGASQGGLNSLLASLGMGGPSRPTGPGDPAHKPGFGGVLGGIATAMGGVAAGTGMDGLLQRTRTRDAAERAQVTEDGEAGLMIRAMIQSARADGEIDAHERAALMEVLGDSDEHDRDFLEREMMAPIDPAGLAAQTPAGMEIEVYTASVVAIEPDNRAEAEHLHALAEALGLERNVVNDVHDALGKPRLY